MRVVIIGNGVIANLCALYLDRRLSDAAQVTMIGPESRQGMPVVGESTIEITAQFLEEDLGLGEYLRTTHYPKYALTYYFQLDPDKPEDRTYSVHCNEAAPIDLKDLPGWEGPMARPPSWQLNRHVFDKDIRGFVDETAVERIFGLVDDVVISPDGEHTVSFADADGQKSELQADWVIDASGRRRVLSRRLGLDVRRRGARDVFWFRLADFDRSHLAAINALGPQPPEEGEPYHYDRYFSTHHFFGRGNWIWCIPLRQADGSELMSIGLSSRRDVYEHDVRSIEAFQEHVRGEHPCIADLVDSGEVLDTNLLRGYAYTSDHVYSADRWAMLGDAAFSPDPLFSNGLAFSTIQIRQLGELIAQDEQGAHDPDFVDKLSRMFLAPFDAGQAAIDDWYDTMHDPYLANLRLYWIEISYFYLLLPLVHNRCYCDPQMTCAWLALMSRDKGGKGFELPKPLLDSRKRFDKARPEHFIYMGKEKVNSRALEDTRDLRVLAEQFKEGARVRGALIDATLDRTGRASDPVDPRAVAEGAAD